MVIAYRFGYVLAEGSYNIDIDSNTNTPNTNTNTSINEISQTFPVLDRNLFVQVVKLHILSNYGNDDFTCLYRFKIHGDRQINF